MGNSVRQPLLVCLFACFGFIDQVLEEHTGSNVVGPKESSFELDTYRRGHLASIMLYSAQLLRLPSKTVTG
jgi:hypothetical protein